MFVIKNDILKLTVSPQGAEIQSLKHLPSGHEFLWQGDPAWWNRRAPNLFPLVGSLKDGRIAFAGTSYPLRKHGFARDCAFEVVNESATTLQFALQANAETRREYPFDFDFELRYRLEGPRLSIAAFVSSPTDLRFSYGAHPAFNCPVLPGETFEDYAVEFQQAESGRPLRINAAGLLDGSSEDFPGSGRVMPLQASLFQKDVLIWRKLDSSWIRLFNRAGTVSLTMDFAGFPCLGIWTKPGAPFVCLEPWYGLPDSVDAAGSAETKDQLVFLPAGKVFCAEYHIDIDVKT